MKLPHRRHLWTLLIAAGILLAISVWVGTYLSWRSNSVALNLGKLGNYRQVFTPISDPRILSLYRPLTAIDGWITGHDVSVYGPIVSYPSTVALPEVATELPTFLDTAVPDPPDENPTGKDASSE